MYNTRQYTSEITIKIRSLGTCGNFAGNLNLYTIHCLGNWYYEKQAYTVYIPVNINDVKM
jgi:hypothetical protein